MWVIPERMAADVGHAVLERALEEGLAAPRSADLNARRCGATHPGRKVPDPSRNDICGTVRQTRSVIHGTCCRDPGVVSLQCARMDGPACRAGSRGQARDDSSRLHQAVDDVEQQGDVLGARQAVLAVGHGGDARPVAREVRHQVERVLPGHVGVLQAVQDVHRPAGIERLDADQVVAAVLEEGARDRIGAIAVARRAQVDALLLDVLAAGARAGCSTSARSCPRPARSGPAP